MSDLTQLLTDPTLCTQLQSFNPTMLVGLSGAPAVEQLVQYVKEQWGLPSKLSPIAAVLLGVLINVGLAAYLGMPIQDAVAVGAATGALSSGIHIVKE